MSFPQTDYAGRLPYGLWYGPEDRTEYLFDRGYKAIASRPVDAPWVVTVYPKRRFIDAGPGRLELYYYSDSTSPRRDETMQATCERIMSYFCLGRDVRYWLTVNRERGAKPLPGLLSPKTRGKYLPGEMNRKRQEEVELTYLTPDQCAAKMHHDTVAYLLG